jgi:nucleotide-binding universal stress UspA family protein
MYRKILIPIDGSALSLAAATKGIAFAHEVGAEVVAFYAPQAYQLPITIESPMAIYPTEAEYKKLARQ